MDETIYRIIRHKSNEFEVESLGKVLSARARGKLKRDGELIVGDFVRLEETGGEYVITQVLKRRNSLFRPNVANVDLVVIVVAPMPQIDWFLVDKLIVNCKKAGVDCAICLNKTDISPSEYDELCSQYGADVTAIVSVSAKNGDVSQLLSIIKGKLVCFAGQSAVGKSTISNNILGGNYREVGDLSDKISRGKNTTTSAAILSSDDGFMFIDTPGFSMLDLVAEDAENLAGYYEEYVSLADECKFHPCTHVYEPDCAVKRAVINGKISSKRYERYVKIFEECKTANKTQRRTR